MKQTKTKDNNPSDEVIAQSSGVDSEPPKDGLWGPCLHSRAEPAADPLGFKDEYADTRRTELTIKMHDFMQLINSKFFLVAKKQLEYTQKQLGVKIKVEIVKQE